MTTISIRVDAETTALIESLAQEGENRSETIRRALQDAARLRRRELMLSEASECADDQDDLAEAAAIQEDLAELRAW